MATAAILAGGQSRRMGMDKALVLFQGKPLVKHVIERLPEVYDIILIARQPDQYAALGIPVHADIVPDLGPIGGLRTALTLVQHDQVIVVGCDMPFINPLLLKKLLAMQTENHADAVVPLWRGKSQPLHAVYHRYCLPKIESALAAGTRRMQDLLDQIDTRWVNEAEYAPLETDGLAFTNMNTPADLEHASTEMR